MRRAATANNAFFIFLLFRLFFVCIIKISENPKSLIQQLFFYEGKLSGLTLSFDSETVVPLYLINLKVPELPAVYLHADHGTYFLPALESCRPGIDE